MVEKIGGFFREFLGEGYTLEYGAMLRGRSGAVHKVDLAAKSLDGKLVVCLRDNHRNENDDETRIVGLFVIAYDLDCRAAYIVKQEPSSATISRILKEYDIVLGIE